MYSYGRLPFELNLRLVVLIWKIWQSIRFSSIILAHRYHRTECKHMPSKYNCFMLPSYYFKHINVNHSDLDILKSVIQCAFVLKDTSTCLPFCSKQKKTIQMQWLHRPAQEARWFLLTNFSFDPWQSRWQKSFWQLGTCCEVGKEMDCDSPWRWSPRTSIQQMMNFTLIWENITLQWRYNVFRSTGLIIK